MYPACQRQPPDASSSMTSPASRLASIRRSSQTSTRSQEESSILTHFKNLVWYPACRGSVYQTSTVETNDIEIYVRPDEDDNYTSTQRVAGSSETTQYNHDTMPVRPEDGTIILHRNEVKDLVEARKVQSTRHLPQAVPYAPPERKRQQEKGWREGAALACLAFVLLLVGIATTVIILKKSRNSAAQTGKGKQTVGPQEILHRNETLLALLPAYAIKSLHDASSPQCMAFDWTVNDPHFGSYPAWRLRQRFALATFFYATEGYAWEKNENWLSYEVSECDWDFIPCEDIVMFSEFQANQHDVNSYLVDLASANCMYANPCGDSDQSDHRYRYLLRAKGGSGTMPPEISMLTSLMALGVAAAKLEGSIPTEIGLLSSLEILVFMLDLLTGSIPTEVGLLQNLRVSRIYLGILFEWYPMH